MHYSRCAFSKNNLETITVLVSHIQRFRVRHGLSCVFGPVWPVGAGCYSQAVLPMPLSKPLYGMRQLLRHFNNTSVTLQGNDRKHFVALTCIDIQDSD